MGVGAFGVGRDLRRSSTSTGSGSEPTISRISLMAWNLVRAFEPPVAGKTLSFFLALDQLGDDRHVRVDVDAFHLARERVEAVVARARRRRDRSGGRRRRLLTNGNCFRDSALLL